ncbi:MAG: Nif11-like leader peptide family natural product precursor [Hormoscilla sp. GUM202]|nr:Nif11-like leader peptide family natural product precursor [Hormoscilla sp. GUM202]
MSHQEIKKFIVAAKQDESLRARLKDAQPEEIIRIATEAGFNFSEEVKERFRNRWAGVYFCPQREDVDEICPALCPPGFRSLAEYSRSTRSPWDTEENPKYR